MSEPIANRAGEPLCPFCDSLSLGDEERWRISDVVATPLQQRVRYYECGGCGFMAMFAESPR